jgi:flagellar motor switch protein FliG
VLLALGVSVASELVRHLNRAEVQSLLEHLSLAWQLPRDRVVEVLREFREATRSEVQMVFDTDAFMQDELVRSFGAEAGADLLEQLESLLSLEGIEALRVRDGDWIHGQIKDEHPQIIATILALLDPGKASEVAGFFSTDLRNERLLRVALLARVEPGALGELNEVLLALASGDHSHRSALGGIRSAAELLSALPEGMDAAAIERIRQHNPMLAGRLVERMFTFEHIAELEDRSIQTLLAEVAQEQLAVALRGTSPPCASASLAIFQSARRAPLWRLCGVRRLWRLPTWRRRKSRSLRSAACCTRNNAWCLLEPDRRRLLSGDSPVSPQ